MTTKVTGGPAFPVPGLANLPNGEFIHPEAGMTMRDYFAGQAIQGILANPACSTSPFTTVRQYAKDLTRIAFIYADEMLEARK